MIVAGIKKARYSWVMVVFLFYWLFLPPILGKHSSYFVALFSFAYLLWHYKLFFKCVYINRFIWLYLGLFFFLLYDLFLALPNGGTRIPIYHVLYWMVSIIPGAFCICLHAKKYKQGIEYILRLVLWAALIQSIISIAAFIYNPLKLFLISKLETDNTIVTETYVNEIFYRLFGFSSGLTFDMPSAMAIISGIAIYLGAKKNWRYFLFVPTIAFSAMINARTSMVVLAVAVLIFAAGSLKPTRKTFAMIIILPIVAAVVLTLGGLVLQRVSPLTYGWVESGFNQILDFFRNETGYGYFEYLTDPRKWIVPSGTQLLFGTGYRAMGGNPFGVRSDIGYINDLWFGGVLYTVALYLATTLCFVATHRFSWKKEDGRVSRYVLSVYIVMLPILNFKTPIIAMGPFTSVVIIVMIYTGLIKRENKIII